jgi:hypothetical protein
MQQIRTKLVNEKPGNYSSSVLVLGSLVHESSYALLLPFLQKFVEFLLEFNLFRGFLLDET